MTPEDLLLELRDIHLPEAMAASAGASWSFIPFIVLIGLLLMLLLVRYRRSRVWLHQARRTLIQIDKQIDEQINKQFDESKHAENSDEVKVGAKRVGEQKSKKNSSYSLSAKALLDLASRVAPFRDVTPLPNAAFLPLEQIDSRQVKLLQEHLQKVLSQ